MLKNEVLGEKVMKKVKGGADPESCTCGPIPMCFCQPPLFWNASGKYDSYTWDRNANNVWFDD